jgi:DNA helicase-2/ATP-dependent DNA helicase PcrA
MPLTPDEPVTDEVDEPLPAAGFISPYKEYHFSHHQYEAKREEYLRFLSGLKSFVEILRQYRQGQIVKVDDLVRFVDLHEQNNIPLNDANPFTNAPSAVSLMTVHKAKGLEFDTVIILSAQQEIWASGGRHSLLPFPINLPIAPAGDTSDDQLRLLYVALTRAKRHLYLAAYERDERGKDALPLEFLTGYEKVNPELRQTEVDTVTLLEPLVPDYLEPPFIADEESLLAHLVKEYQLSVTHLNNYLDVTAGGPRLFLEQNLLRFPQPKSKNGIFGTVMHGVLERVHVVLKKDGRVPDLETVLEFLAEAIARTRLSQFDKDHLHERGIDALTALYKEKKDGFSPEHLVEYNFKQEGAAVGEAHLTGKIDRLVKVNSNEMLVCDYKTGSAETQWIDSSVKLWKYRNQLYFYKLLVENSRQFGNAFKVKRGLLEFVEPLDGHIIDLPLDLEPEYAERMVGLVRVVYNKIKALDFPDVTDYQSTVRGIESFCDDLLAGRV